MHLHKYAPRCLDIMRCDAIRARGLEGEKYSGAGILCCDWSMNWAVLEIKNKTYMHKCNFALKNWLKNRKFHMHRHNFTKFLMHRANLTCICACKNSFEHWNRALFHKMFFEIFFLHIYLQFITCVIARSNPRRLLPIWCELLRGHYKSTMTPYDRRVWRWHYRERQ